MKQLNPWRTYVYYDEEEDKYFLVGIKYNHLKFIEGEYGIPRKLYESLKDHKRVSSKAYFKFSLYKRNCIRIEKDSESCVLLFNSLKDEKRALLNLSRLIR